MMTSIKLVLRSWIVQLNGDLQQIVERSVIRLFEQLLSCEIALAPRGELVFNASIQLIGGKFALASPFWQCSDEYRDGFAGSLLMTGGAGNCKCMTCRLSEEYSKTCDSSMVRVTSVRRQRRV
jgi:hypothetical protein